MTASNRGWMWLAKPFWELWFITGWKWASHTAYWIQGRGL